MQKNTGTETATTYVLPTRQISQLSETDRASLTAPYHWASAADARAAIDRMVNTNGFEYARYEAPGLEVFALYVDGEILTVIVIEDDTVARLHTAVRRERPVTITYTKADGTETLRTIEPHSLRTTNAGDVIVKAADRDSGEMRTFRADRISAYTVHRSRFTVRLEAPAPSKAELAEQFRAGREIKTYMAPHVRLEPKGWTGRVIPGTRSLGASGESVRVELDPEYAHHTASGSVRVSLDLLSEL
jgi:hypothetical protein